MGKHPFYTALGWAVWKLGKRYARQRVSEATHPPKRKKWLRVGVVSVLAIGVVGAGAYALTADDAVT